MAQEEHDLPTEPRPDSPVNQRILFEWDGMLHRALDHFWDKMQVNAANSKPPRIHVYERTLSVIAFGLSVASLVSVWWCMQDAAKDRQWYDREISRLVHEVNVRDVLLQDHDALMIREGLKQPGDMAKGPSGNLEYQPRPH